MKKYRRLLIAALSAVILTMMLAASVTVNAQSTAEVSGVQASSEATPAGGTEGNEEEASGFRMLSIQGFAIVIAGTGVAAAFVLVRAKLGRKVTGYSPSDDQNLFKSKK